MDDLRLPQHNMPDPRTQRLIRKLDKAPMTIAQLTESERLTEAAVYSTIQGARAMGFVITARPGAPTTFHFNRKP